jgi:YesN/AraC family two-component response regulator
MILHIKNMLSSRCKTIVRKELQTLGFDSHCEELGTVYVSANINCQKLKLLQLRLQLAGLDLVVDKKTTVSNQIKDHIKEILGLQEDYSESTVTSYLRKKMNMDNPTLAKAFSERNKLTMKQYIISERVKRVKEMILNHRDNLSDISSKLHYSSTAHLCNEFKRVTGFTPKIFRNNHFSSSFI